MRNLLQFTNNEGEVFFVEISDPPVSESVRGFTEEGNRGLIQNATQSFETAIKPLSEISNTLINCIKKIYTSPNEIEVELGLKFNAKAGLILTSFDSEANMKIVLKWQNSKTD